MLNISINSFSFIYGTIPMEPNNGGGYVFDCRALPNPGRYDEYKSLTGKDEPVITYLEKEEEVHQFLDHVFALVDQSVEVYTKRGFTNLMLSFGCTGGQHRSVYSAEKLAKHLAQKFENININIRHIAREEAENQKKN